MTTRRDRREPSDASAPRDERRGPRFRKPPLRVMPTTLWEYPSQHYNSSSGQEIQGDPAFEGATPSWVIWQVLQRYTRPNDLVVDPMCGSGTTIDVARDLGRRVLGYDLSPTRQDIFKADARELPLESGKADFVFVDPPYSTHIEYSADARCIGRLDAAAPPAQAGDVTGQAYFEAMEEVIAEIHRVLKNRRYMALYVSDSWRKRRGEPGEGAGVFMPIGFELFSVLRDYFTPIDIVCVVRQNAKLERGNYRRAAVEGNFFLRGFNYLFIMKRSENPSAVVDFDDEA